MPGPPGGRSRRRGGGGGGGGGGGVTMTRSLLLFFVVMVAVAFMGNPPVVVEAARGRTPGTDKGSTLGFQGGWSKESIPNPTIPAGAAGGVCGGHVPRGGSSFLCNPDYILSAPGALKVHEMLNQVQKEVGVTCQGGELKQAMQLAVVVINRIRPTRLTMGEDEEAELLARTLHNTWGVGHRPCQSGALLLLSVQDRQAYLSRGSGLSRILTARRTEAMIDRIKPTLRGAEYDAAVVEAITAIREFVDKGPEGFWESGMGVVVLVVGVFAVMVALRWREERRREAEDRRRRREWEECRKKLERIARERERQRRSLEGEEADDDGTAGPTAESCPICLEEYTKEGVAGGEGVRGAPPQLVGVDGRPVVFLPCSHSFCQACLQQWMQRDSRCPICRRDANGGDDGGHGGTRPHHPRGGPCEPSGGSTSTGGGADTSNTYNLRDRRGRAQHDDGGRVAALRLLMAAETAYRLSSLRRQYPTIVPQAQVDSWLRVGPQGGGADLTMPPPPVVTPSSSSSSLDRLSSARWRSSESSGGFGGGRSSGGHGGSW